MANTTQTSSLIQYDLNDPITKLMLMTTTKPDPKFDRKQRKTQSFENQPLLPKQIEIDFHGNSIYTNQLVTEYQNQNQKLKVNRKIVYQTVKGMHQMLNTPFDQHWSGQYLPDQNSVILNYHDQVYYDVKFSDQFNDDSSTDIDNEKLRLLATIDQYAPQDINNLMIDILHQDASYQASFQPNFTAFNALKNLWLAQTQTIQFKTVDQKIQIPQAPKNAFTEILGTVLATRDDHDQNRRRIQLTYADLVAFYHEVQNHQLTNATQKVQNWLFRNSQSTQSVNDMLTILKYYPNFDQIQDQIQPITYQADPQFQKIIKQFKKDRFFPKTGQYVMKVYQIEQPNPRVKPNQNHFMGIHGTQGISIPTILCGGFKNHQQLQNDGNAQYVDTGQALGDGTYFAKLDQASKALNYGAHNTAFLIIADIAYQKPVHVNAYDPSINRHHQYDFIMGDTVGISHSYDEFVAVNPQDQVTLKYLLEISPIKHNQK